MRILIIEDSKTDALWLQRLAEQQGHNVECLESFEALSGVNLKDFSVAIVDLHLPNSDPDEILQKARKLPMPAVIMTGDNGPETAAMVGEAQLGYFIKHIHDFNAYLNYAKGLAEARHSIEKEFAEKDAEIAEKERLLARLRGCKLFQGA